MQQFKLKQTFKKNQYILDVSPVLDLGLYSRVILCNTIKNKEIPIELKNKFPKLIEKTKLKS